MYKLWTMTLLVSLFASHLAGAQSLPKAVVMPGATDSRQLSQAEWKSILRDLKTGRPLGLQTLKGQALVVQGPGTSGGGNESEAEFSYLAQQVFADFAAQGIVDPRLELAKKSFAIVSKDKAFQFTDKKLFLDGKEKAAINDFDVFFLLINETRWNESDFAQKRTLLVHELLGLSRAFDASIDDSDYQLTNDLFAKLTEANQKNFLKKADFPKHFTAAATHELNLKTQGDVLRTDAGIEQVCKNVAGEMTVAVQTKILGQNKIAISFAITCQLPDGKIFGHSEGRDMEDVVEIVSGNLLQMKNDFGSFIVGWISGENIFVRSPVMVLSVQKNSHGHFDFKFDFNRGSAQESVRAMLTP
ncbi:MAG TPA: hypothetical protein VGE46_01915 [Bdellovibrio sp.]